MAGFQLYDILRRLDMVVETVQQSYASLSRTMAEQTRSSVQSVDVLLACTQRWRAAACSELGAPIRVANGQIASYAIYRDISERRLADAERDKLETRLRQSIKLEAIGTMAGGIAHDFNNIVAAILGYGDTMHRFPTDCCRQGATFACGCRIQVAG
jgi:C4-dicarboxylate-specific signal transduction histidine kinase